MGEPNRYQIITPNDELLFATLAVEVSRGEDEHAPIYIVGIADIFSLGEAARSKWLRRTVLQAAKGDGDNSEDFMVEGSIVRSIADKRTVLKDAPVLRFMHEHSMRFIQLVDMMDLGFVERTRGPKPVEDRYRNTVYPEILQFRDNGEAAMRSYNALQRFSE